MIKFNRYAHINDFIAHYASTQNRPDIEQIVINGINSDQDAQCFAEFIWLVADLINTDEENGNEVLGSKDNTDVLPDLSYEATKLFRDTGYFSTWESVSSNHIPKDS